MNVREIQTQMSEPVLIFFCMKQAGDETGSECV